MTPEENTLLTQVGPGTPGGELFRRYWHPVALLPEISEETPTKFVRMLGEDLVLFRDKSGRVGLIGDHCPHRGASLLYGRVEERGIACAYHGWLYDVNGNCLETPAEPAESLLHLTVKHKAYSVREHYGMYWTYMGPNPAPLLPRYDVPELGPISVVKLTSQFDCNWLQIMENHVDQSHVVILHQNTGAGGGRTPASTTRGLVDELALIEYAETPFGIKRRQVHTNGLDDTDLCPFPCTQRVFNDISVKVPIDDFHTRQFSIYTDIPFDGEPAEQGPIQYCIDLTSDGKSQADAIHPVATYHMNVLRFQDVMALETQGPISDRPNERLGTADRGVALLREVLKREIDKVQQGLDPMGVVRDPETPPVETFIQSYVDNVRKGMIHPHSHDARGTRPLAAVAGAV
ncbi:MAG TPA: Rieske 2Fe-2S domain-containing protein [Chloroflexota bacterium]|jgi:5,5'-dehydrodivanillate O-demethylase